MKKEELKEYLLSEGYKYEKDTEFPRDVFINYIEDHLLEVFIDRWTMKIVYHYAPNSRRATSALTEKIDLGVFKLMVQALTSDD
jgi:hypothetical protein